MWRKGKKVDWYLSIAGFWQLCVIGISGSLYTEATSTNPVMWKIAVLVPFDCAFTIALALTWYLIRKKIKK
jgi:hypothetical protein